MSKLTAPLFSFTASGKIANALVYFGWKGLNVVRSYVIPANPQSTRQTVQRDYLKDCVTAIHDAQALAAHPLNAADQTAYALWGSTYPNPRTWFNQIVKNWLDVNVDGKDPSIYRAGGITDLLPTSFFARVWFTKKATDDAPGDVRFYFGRSKTALINKTNVISVSDSDYYTGQLTGLTPNTEYYWQLRVEDDEAGEGVRSGIYHLKTPAA